MISKSLTNVYQKRQYALNHSYGSMVPGFPRLSGKEKRESLPKVSKVSTKLISIKGETKIELFGKSLNYKGELNKNYKAHGYGKAMSTGQKKKTKIKGTFFRD